MRLTALPITLALLSSTSVALAAPHAPSGAHPRIWLDGETLAALQASASDPASPASRAVIMCKAVRDNPGDHESGGFQGFEFVDVLSWCLLAWEAAGDPEDLSTALDYFKVLLDDYETVGDGQGGDDVVRHDTGYGMRTFAPYTAIAYDWLHDAPGMTASLRARARKRFRAWTEWYATHGYLSRVPGSNYHAGWVFAATLIAIAEGGEAGDTGDALWAEVVDSIWGQDLAPAIAAGGVLEGGDWPEGWQYGTLSVLEIAMAARALGEQGVVIPDVDTWAGALTVRNIHALTPVTRRVFAGGDVEATTVNLTPEISVLSATIAGPAPDEAKAWARALQTDLALTPAVGSDNLYAALAGAVKGDTAPYPGDRTTLLTGAGNLFMRGSWSEETVWAVFHCASQQVPDHQHPDAGNWVLTRGADDLVVDPTPYGSISTLTGNAPAVGSHVLPPGYSPSQGIWGTTAGLRWHRRSETGVVAARCDYADNFRVPGKRALSHVRGCIQHAS